MSLRDYVGWHDDYERLGSRLHLRLVVVRDLVAGVLDELPEGPERVISVCAGQGHDVVSVARRHRRGSDLVERDPHNAAAARAAVDTAGLRGLEVLEADAGSSDAYAGVCPADVVLVCGVLGNIPDDEIERTLKFLPRLCAAGAWVVWTRSPRPAGIIATIEGWLVEAGLSRGRSSSPTRRSSASAPHSSSGQPSRFKAVRASSSSGVELASPRARPVRPPTILAASDTR